MTDIEPEAAPASYVDFRDTGGIHVVVNDQKRRLRTPRLREFRHLVDLWRDEADKLNGIAEENMVFLTELQRLGDEREARDEPRILDVEQDENMERGRRLSDVTEDAGLRMWVEIIRTLGVTDNDRQVEVDDLPVYFGDTGLVATVIGHWRTVPSRSGAR